MRLMVVRLHTPFDGVFGASTQSKDQVARRGVLLSEQLYGRGI